ncbi:SOS response-associated peptidase [Bacillus lacus]|uniref:Abasic site processing protein n=1 Tax=Metabacillus lacus TaxID=1983721 RepID=A0A7X2IWI8_9BACI|nr:SOS response-associated peptidase [Metabacillus lacus]
MCGRYSLFDNLETLQNEFHFQMNENSSLEPKYNIAPSQHVLAIASRNGARIGNFLKWGLIPSWSKDSKIGYKLINARAETAHQKPSFMNSFHSKRCIIPCSGYFEWARSESGKQPYRFHMRNNKPFALAGLYETWSSSSDVIHSCTILTTEANDLQAEIHERMPVILNSEAVSVWLREESTLPDLQSLLVLYSSSEMTMTALSDLVNSPSNQTAEVLTPLNSL